MANYDGARVYRYFIIHDSRKDLGAVHLLSIQKRSKRETINLCEILHYNPFEIKIDAPHTITTEIEKEEVDEVVGMYEVYGTGKYLPVCTIKLEFLEDTFLHIEKDKCLVMISKQKPRKN